MKPYRYVDSLGKEPRPERKRDDDWRALTDGERTAVESFLSGDLHYDSLPRRSLTFLRRWEGVS